MSQYAHPSSREAARLRKQRQRERQRAAAIAKANADAQLIEAHAERLTPAILRHPIATPDGRMLVGARVAIVDGPGARSMLIVPAWTTDDGSRTSPTFPAARTEAEAQRQVAEALAMARRANGTDVRVQLVNDMTGRLVLNVRPKAV